MTISPNDQQFANALARLIEVRQNGEIRPATANDVLELMGSGGRRYVLRAKNGRVAGLYASDVEGGWSEKQRKAIVLDDPAVAFASREEGRRYGIDVRVIRIRRKGTCGLDLVRLRPDIGVANKDGVVSMDIPRADAMEFLAALTAAKTSGGEH